MTMQSLDLLPALRELPTDGPEQQRSYRQQIETLLATDPATAAAEVASAVSITTGLLWSELDINDDLHQRLQEAYEMAAPVQSGAVPLHDAFAEAQHNGAEATQGFINNIKGKVAELEVKDWLEGQGATVFLPDAQNYPGIDMLAIWPDGTEVPIQVKTHAAESAGNIQSLMLDNSEVQFAVSSEVFDKIAERSPELIDRMVDIGATAELEGNIDEGLGILTDNLGIDIPDSVGEIIPYAGAIIAASRLIYSVIQTERQFKAVDRTTRNKIQVVQTLTLMSRMGVTTVLSTVGGMGGGAAGSVIPGVGNLVGGIAGTVAGAGMGMYLNRHLQPRMLTLALDITGLTNDDLFYYKNKPHIDQVALSFRQSANALAVAPAT